MSMCRCYFVQCDMLEGRRYKLNQEVKEEAVKWRNAHAIYSSAEGQQPLFRPSSSIPLLLSYVQRTMIQQPIVRRLCKMRR